MAIIETIIPKPAYNVLLHLTGEARPDVALSLALRELVARRLQESREKIAAFEQSYAMDFDHFQKAWEAGKISNAYSYQVESDYWEWEATVTDLARLEELTEWLG
jgi:hypothetical protein